VIMTSPGRRRDMTAYNMVRFKVKPGREKEFLDAHRHLKRDFPGLRRGGLIKTGERAYGFVGEWDDLASLAAARPASASRSSANICGIGIVRVPSGMMNSRRLPSGRSASSAS